MSKAQTFDKTPVPPGRSKKKRKSRYQARGRQATKADLDAIEKILPPAPYQRDLLLEYLHLLQDQYNQLSKPHLTALSEITGFSLAEIHEVASFYHNFEITEELDPSLNAPIKVCESLSCALAGAGELYQDLQSQIPGSRVKKAACMGRCQSAPVVRKGDTYLEKATTEKVLDQETDVKSENSILTLDDYLGQQGFSTLNQLRSNTVSSQDLIETLKVSGHRGLGGAGFPHAVKINSVLSKEGPRYLAVNADESEPGTFKDRHFMNSNPFQFLEGMLIAAELVDADAIYIFLRDEYADTRQILEKSLKELADKSILGNCPVHLRRGAGSYICGEESAMLESLEGKRALPRQKPPFPAHVGLFGKPTLINNVETLYWLPEIIRKGADWYTQDGRHGHKGIRTFSLSGHVKKPGVYTAPAGITAEELINEYGGGMKDGHTFKAYLPGGASGGILPASMANIPLDFGTLEKHGCFIGSAAVIVLSDQDNMKMVARNLMDFFEDESCGQCTPCRVGTQKASQLMQEQDWDLPLLEELSEVMQQASICGLGQAAPNGLLCLMKYFPEDLA
ncbi:NADH-quinone oxidoreductase subunit F [Sneathiella sp. P13V-1]|uniref:NADH-ubiquinone oxidoreductase-F iron-sulfur binding region domain-containing protein n=1 Tax=Sneathiella sp. P13V-1 TaxID=2697366 RepID=UPI00187B2505|nr:NADH-ubiquinone oxidoreductase-F iron-sulfur binding region domain-containing protein [Sneathiella sp. P13V-1]MBE7638560.1 NADH-quinone oxidoreductase subunit F [Sneathiella sp. P13V-1]